MLPQFLSNQEKQRLIKEKPYIIVHNTIDYALEELFDITYPQKKDTKTEAEVTEYSQAITNSQPDEWGSWVYYPWLNAVVHMPPKPEFRALRTSRNRNLITSEEQTKLYQATILIVGMSVGSNIVEALVSQGIAGKLILIDMDVIEPTNLNRIRAPYHQVGLHKVEAISRKIREIDPYIEIVAYNDGLNDENLDNVFDEHAIDIVIDEMDELRMKVMLRNKAKAKRLPVIMAADDGDDALLDIERYDLNPDLKLFHGLIPEEIIDQITSQTFPRAHTGLLIGKYFVGAENIPLRMYQSLAEVGKSLPSWPQLGGAAALSGVSLAFAAKRILLKQPVEEGRILVSLNQKLSSDYDRQLQNSELKQHQKQLEESL